MAMRSPTPMDVTIDLEMNKSQEAFGYAATPVGS
jgi:hypothetical protein